MCCISTLKSSNEAKIYSIDLGVGRVKLPVPRDL